MSERIYRNSDAHSSQNHSKVTPKNRYSSKPYYSNDRSNLSIEELDSEDEFIFNLAGISQYSDTYTKLSQQDRVASNELDAGESQIAHTDNFSNDNYNRIDTNSKKTLEGKDSTSDHQYNIKPEQLFQTTNPEQTHLYVAFLPAIPVAIVGGFVLVAVGGVLLLQVENENGELVTVNEYASRPIAELLEAISNDIKNYYQTEDEVSKIKEWVAPALEKIVVTQEPENQVYTTPDGEQQTVEHTGSVPPQVETGTPPFDTESAEKVPTNTGGQTQVQQDASDYVLEAQVDRDFNNPEVRRRDEIAHGGYYSRKNLRKKFQEANISTRTKHIEATTEAEAKRKSYTEAQYLPGINHGALERRAMIEGDYLMPRRSEAYWNFYRSDDFFGYDQGEKTRWIRSEYSSGTIHGHPMNLKRLSKYVKNPTP